MVLTFPAKLAGLGLGSISRIRDGSTVTQDRLDTLYRLQKNTIAALDRLYRDLDAAPGTTLQVGNYRITPGELRESIKFVVMNDTGTA